MHVLQASCLLAVLFFAKGRLLEGYYHAGAATRLAVGLGLHQISTSDWLASTAGSGSSPQPSPDSIGSHANGNAVGNGNSNGSGRGGHGGGSSILAPPVDAVELGERILAFWQVYNLDRCWAVATGLPVALSDDKYPRTRIETAWPRLMEDYELVCSIFLFHCRCPCLPYPTFPGTNSRRGLFIDALSLLASHRRPVHHRRLDAYAQGQGDNAVRAGRATLLQLRHGRADDGEVLGRLS